MGTWPEGSWRTAAASAACSWLLPSTAAAAASAAWAPPLRCSSAAVRDCSRTASWRSSAKAATRLQATAAATPPSVPALAAGDHSSRGHSRGSCR